MALISSRILPVSACASNSATSLPAGCRALIHSRIAQVSRTRVFTLALPLFVGGERFDQIGSGRGAFQFLPAGFFREDDLLPAQFDGQLGALRQIERVADRLRDGDLTLGGDSYHS